jgi:hypothetical protein
LPRRRWKSSPPNCCDCRRAALAADDWRWRQHPVVAKGLQSTVEIAHARMSAITPRQVLLLRRSKEGVASEATKLRMRGRADRPLLNEQETNKGAAITRQVGLKVTHCRRSVRQKSR